MIITMTHMREAGYCSRGVRAFFISHGFDWMDFLKNGIPSEKLESTKDVMALNVVRLANGRK